MGLDATDHTTRRDLVCNEEYVNNKNIDLEDNTGTLYDTINNKNYLSKQRSSIVQSANQMSPNYIDNVHIRQKFMPRSPSLGIKESVKTAKGDLSTYDIDLSKYPKSEKVKQQQLRKMKGAFIANCSSPKHQKNKYSSPVFDSIKKKETPESTYDISKFNNESTPTKRRRNNIICIPQYVIDSLVDTNSNLDTHSNGVMFRFLDYFKQEIYIDPVRMSNGSTYERNEILNWVKEFGLIDPITKDKVGTSMVSNKELKREIKNWMNHITTRSFKMNEKLQESAGKWIEAKGRDKLNTKIHMRNFLKAYDQSISLFKDKPRASVKRKKTDDGNTGIKVHGNGTTHEEQSNVHQSFEKVFFFVIKMISQVLFIEVIKIISQILF